MTFVDTNILISAISPGIEDRPKAERSGVERLKLGRAAVRLVG